MSDGFVARLCDSLPEIVLLIDGAGLVRLCNRRAARLLGRDTAEIVGRPLVEFVAGDPAPALAYLQRCAGSGGMLPGSLPLVARSGPTMLRAQGAAVRADDGALLVLLRCLEKQEASQRFLDLNARLVKLSDKLHRQGRLQNDLQRALEEREVLLKEVHHRVRNNLQVITSFLGLQARQTESESARLALREAQARIRVLGLIHGQLYTEDHLGEVDLGRLVPTLCSQLALVYGVSPERVRFSIGLPSWRLDLSGAVPVALLITEAVTNALKHGFPKDRSGIVSVELQERDELCILRIADDGVGLPEDRRDAMRRSLGMQLMQALAEQCDGRFEMRSASGVEVQITLPADKPGS